MTKDADIRAFLHKYHIRDYHIDRECRVVDEFTVCEGAAKIDIAIINGSLHGIEIKSEKDTLRRLPRQIELYNEVFDYLTIVVGKNHLEKVRNLVPDWWGIIVVEIKNSTLKAKNVRKHRFNKKSEKYAIASLLWKQEALSVLKDLGEDAGMKSKNRPQIWGKLAHVVDKNDLSSIVRQKLLNRTNWKVHE